MQAKDVIKRVLLSEKGTRLAEQNRYFVEADLKATKQEIRQAVEAQFGVHVLKVRTSVMKGGTHTVRGTRRSVQDSSWKRAIVTVKDGERIETV